MTAAPDPFGLHGRIGLVTGGSRGLGRAIAEEFARGGAEGIVIVGRDPESLKGAAEQVELLGVPCLGIVGDVTKEEEVDEVVDSACLEFGRIDILVNNAGGATFKAPVKDMRVDGWQKMIDLNLLSTFLVSKRVLQCWESESRQGRSIVNVGSTSSLRAFPELAYYSASKHGLVGLTKTLAREVADQGIRVNLVCPHLLSTDLTKSYRTGSNAEQFVSDIPMQRWGNVEEVAHVVRFLASEAASYVTGALLAVDGGWTS